MKRLFSIVVVAIAVSTLLYAQMRTGNASASPGRYQLIPATVVALAEGDGETRMATVFLLDTETGRIWKYERMSLIERVPPGKPNMFPAHFRGVFVDGFDDFSVQQKLERMLTPGK